MTLHTINNISKSQFSLFICNTLLFFLIKYWANKFYFKKIPVPVHRDHAQLLAYTGSKIHKVSLGQTHHHTGK